MQLKPGGQLYVFLYQVMRIKSHSDHNLLTLTPRKGRIVLNELLLSSDFVYYY